MPQLPRSLDRAVPQGRRQITSVNMTAGAEGALQAADIRASGTRSLAAGLSNLGNSMERAHQKAAETAKELEYTNATSGFTKAMIDQQAALEGDTDWKTQPARFNQAISQARNAAAAQITDPILRRKFLASSEVDIARGMYATKSRAFDLEAKDGVQNLENLTKSALDDFIRAPDEVGRTRVLESVGANINAAVKAGYISEPFAVERRRKFSEDAAVGYVGKFGDRTALAILTGAAGGAPTHPIYSVGAPKGRIKTGNIDLTNRPTVQNPDGSISTVRSMSYRNDAGQEVLIPTVSDEGKILGEREAIEYWSKKGQNLGVFDNPEDANAYAESLHQQQQATYGKDSIGKTVLLPPDVQKAISGAAVNDDDATILARIAQLESAGDKSAVNPNSGAAGVFQFVPKTAAQYGLGDPTDVNASAKAAAKLLVDNRTTLRSILGRDPSPAELYLAHQQGASGAAALIANPDKTAIEVLTGVYGSVEKARNAIVQNGGSEGMTAGEFGEMWKIKYHGGSNDALNAALDFLPGEKPEGGWNFSPTGTMVDFIPQARREEMIDSLLGKVRQEREAARTALMGEVSLAYDDQKTNAYLSGQVDQSFAAKVMASDPGAAGMAKVKALEESAALGRDNNAVKGNTWAQDDTMLAKAAAAVQSGDGSAFAAERYGRLAKVISDKRDWLAKDPAGYAQSNNPVVADAWIAALAPDAEAVDVRLAVDMTRSEQARLGVPDDKVRAIPESLAQPLTDRIKAAKNPEERMAAIMTLASPKDPDTSVMILDEIARHAGDDGTRYALVGGLALEGPEGQRLGLDILAGLDAVDAGAVKLPKGDDVLSAVDEKLGTALSFNPEARGAILDAASVIYANDALRAGKAGEDFDVAKFGAAIDRVTGGVVDYNDAKIIVPRRGMTEDEFEDVMDGLTVQDIGGALPLADDGSQVSIGDIRDGKLQNVGDGVYLVSVAGYPVIDPRTQQPFVLDLRNVQAKIPPLTAPRAIGTPIKPRKGE